MIVLTVYYGLLKDDKKDKKKLKKVGRRRTGRPRPRWLMCATT
jgi:hypothetical protein